MEDFQDLAESGAELMQTGIKIRLMIGCSLLITVIVSCVCVFIMGKKSCKEDEHGKKGIVGRLAAFPPKGIASWIITLIPFFWPIKSAAMVFCKS